MLQRSVGREMYPPIEPYASAMMDVTDGHRIYWETSGNPQGHPALFLHGGPGSGTSPKQRRFFDPNAYRIILFDQRGCGKSEPFSSLENNTTAKLIEDIEALRNLLKVDKWLVFGGSWGSTLALAYAEAYPERVSHLVLRGIFLLRRAELLFFYQEGTSWLYPDAWEDYVAQIPPEERSDMISAYYKRLTSDDPKTRKDACIAWAAWEGQTATLLPDNSVIGSYEAVAESISRIECHYFVNGGFVPEGSLIEKANIDRIRHIPAIIVQGRYDLVCPAKSAWDLHKVWPEADLRFTPDAGHSAFDVGNQKALLDACDQFRPTSFTQS